MKKFNFETLLESILTSLNPRLLIPYQSWLRLWEDLEINALKQAARIYFASWALLYPLHYFVVDTPAGKPLEWYFLYRFSCGTIFALGFVITFLNPRLFGKKYSALVRAWIIFACSYSIVFQYKAFEHWPKTPSFFLPVLAFFGAMAIRKPLLETSLVFIVLNLVAKPGYDLQKGYDFYWLISLTIVLGILAMYLRALFSTEIKLFISNQQQLEAQSKIIEIEQGVSDQLRRFLPKEIYRRVSYAMLKNKKTIIQATDEILKPRLVNAAILHNDIRGSTPLTKKGAEVVLRGILPSQKDGVEIVENNFGIPRLTGDCIFAFFDFDNERLNLNLAIRSAIQIGLSTDLLNSGLNQGAKLLRYSIITCGNVIAGNLGGIEGSRDISVLGDAANLPSRIDKVAKSPLLKSHLSSSSILLSQNAGELLKSTDCKLNLTELSLNALGMQIPDFEEFTLLYLLTASKEALAIIEQDIKQISLSENTFKNPLTNGKKAA